MNVFITGATGFVGRYLVETMLADERFAGADIYCLVRDERKLSDSIRDKIKILAGGSSDMERHAETIAGCEYIFHVAALATFGNNLPYERDNVEFTRKLIEIARRSTVLKRFVFTSTIGAVDRQPQDDCSKPLDESTPPNPMSDYGRSKLECERMLGQSGLPFAIVRPTWVYGPHMRKQSHVRVFIDAVAEGKPFTKIDFPGRISMIHASDLAQALLLTAVHPDAQNKTYFASDGRPISLGGLFKSIARAIGGSAASIRIGLGIPAVMRKLRPYMPFAAQNLFSDVLCASADRLFELGFKPRVAQYQGIVETARWHFREALNGRTLAIVTGGAGGIGREICRQLTGRGYDIAIVDYNAEAAQRAAEELGGEYLVADLGADEGLQSVCDLIERNADRLGVMINNAGIGRRGPLDELSADDLARLLKINSMAPMILSRAALAAFRPAGRGTIVNIGSSAAYQPLPYMAAYAASKAFVVNFTESLIGELLGTKIEVIMASPSGTNTQFQVSSGVKNEDAAKLLKPEQVASAIVRRIGKGSRTFIIGRSGLAMMLVGRMLPKAIQVRLWQRLMTKMR
ncbi:SDR family NAD(P)-dependent oxidoreductase [bacterium]|nr:SDR family NAD(P)-dependent oxidoreductase [bacterium]